MYEATLTVTGTTGYVARFERMLEAYSGGMCAAVAKRRDRTEVEFGGRVVRIQNRLLTSRVTYVVTLRASTKRLCDAMASDLARLAQ
jgi:RNase P/RNase MRP subunit p29